VPVLQHDNFRQKEVLEMIIRKLGEWPASSRRNPFDELERLRRQMDRFLDGHMLGDLPGASFAGVFPLTNLSEDKDAYYVRAELPGIKADALDISITGNSLAISGERDMILPKVKM
jgi:HSP20 family protein